MSFKNESKIKNLLTKMRKFIISKHTNQNKGYSLSPRQMIPTGRTEIQKGIKYNGRVINWITPTEY